jgi:hypothetical protein
MRERLMAVGCGGLTLLMAFLLAGVTVAGVWTEERNAWIGWAITGMFAAFALLMFGVGIRRTDDEEDPFEGNRGLAVALALVVVVAVTIFAVVMFLQGDFWRGATAGS